MFWENHAMGKVIRIKLLVFSVALVCAGKAMANPSEVQLQELSEKLKVCEKFTQEFKHPFTGQTMKRFINGFKGEKCNYLEEMPGNMKMECNYPKEKLGKVSDYYKNPDKFGSKVKSKTKFKDGKPVTETKHFKENQEVKNPLQESLQNGECVVKK